MRKNEHYEYDIVNGLDPSTVLAESATREQARQVKRTLDSYSPQSKHRIIQRHYVVNVKEIR